ncbi:antirestriction protein [Proteus mirabilis]|uniref:Antirestriction protein n=1 Tax=Proteus mirabilis TaxID=584 RepID=A0ABD5LW69_PROMI
MVHLYLSIYLKNTDALPSPITGKRSQRQFAKPAGIAVCLMMYSLWSFQTESDILVDRFYQLRDYAAQHPERSPFPSNRLTTSYCLRIITSYLIHTKSIIRLTR